MQKVTLLFVLLGLLQTTLFAQLSSTAEDLYISPDYASTTALQVIQTPRNEVAIARLELALLEAGIPVIADSRIRTNLTTATTQIRVADTTFSRPYREPIGIELFRPKASDYVVTVSGNFVSFRYTPLATRLDIRIIDTASGRPVAIYFFQQRCNISSEPLAATMKRFARALVLANGGTPTE